MADFYPGAAGEPGIQIAYFNLREGRFRQSNLHLAKPARIGNRHYIEDMYEHRYQKEFGNIARLAWTILRSEHGGFQILFLYLLIHLASVADRRGFQKIADGVRRFVSMGAVERAISSLLRTDYRFVITEAGGCAVDVDKECEFDVAELRFDEWSAAQAERAERLCCAEAGFAVDATVQMGFTRFQSGETARGALCARDNGGWRGITGRSSSVGFPPATVDQFRAWAHGGLEAVRRGAPEGLKDGKRGGVSQCDPA